jgi:ribokinase
MSGERFDAASRQRATARAATVCPDKRSQSNTRAEHTQPKARSRMRVKIRTRLQKPFTAHSVPRTLRFASQKTSGAYSALMKPRVVVVGSISQDLSFFVEQFPRPGETVVGDFRVGPGGKGFNQAVAATRAGVATLFIGAVGRDAFGASARRFATASGVKTLLIEKKKDPTGVAGICIGPEGENHIVVAGGANLALHKQDIPAPALEGADVVVCQCESDLRTVQFVLRAARKAGAIAILNPAPMRADFDLSLLRSTEVLVPNAFEFVALARAFPGTASVLRSTAFRDAGEISERTLPSLKADLLHRLCRGLGVPIVIVTLGERGCFVSQPDVYQRIHAHDVSAVDSTGAGDAFVGGFAAGLVKFNKNVIEAAHYANAVAALAVTQPGAAAAMPTAREISRFLRRRDHA